LFDEMPTALADDFERAADDWRCVRKLKR